MIDFFERDEEELLLNRGDQRIIFVANNYRKEVTSTVLWLLNHNIQIQCFRATPYSMGEDMFLQVEQIIPLPETQEFMIDASEKEKEEKDFSKTVLESEARLVKFWNMFKNHLHEHKIDYLDSVGAKPYYNIGFSKGNGRFGYCIGRHTFRVELYIPNDPNKIFIDNMLKYKEQIESKFDGKLTWERLDSKKASRIKFEMTNSEILQLDGRFNDELYWESLFVWFRTAMIKFYESIYPFWDQVQKQLV